MEGSGHKTLSTLLRESSNIYIYLYIKLSGSFRLFTIYRGKPVDLRFMQMVRKALPNGKFRSR